MHVPGAGYVVLALLIALFGTLSLKYARQLVTVARVLRRGVRTTGECVRVETEPFNRSDAARYFFAFRTEDGERVEFEDLARWSTKEGTRVAVTYFPHDPQRTATISGRHNWSPVLQALALSAGCGMAAAGFTAVLVYQVIGGS